MGPQTRPLGCTGGVRRPVLSELLPGPVRLGGARLRCFRRRLTHRCAAFGLSEALSGGWADSDHMQLDAGPSGRGAQSGHAAAQQLAATGADKHPQHHQHQHHHNHAHSHAHHSRQQLAQLDPQRLHHNQQHHARRHEAAQQVAQRLVPSAAATHATTRSGISAAGVALGVMLAVALQLVGRWVARQAWGRAILDLLDLRRNSGRGASTSGGSDGSNSSSSSGGSGRDLGQGGGADGNGEAADGGGSGAGYDRHQTSRGRSGSDRSVAAAAAVGALPFGTPPGSPLGTMDSIGAFPQPPGAAAAGAGPGAALVPAGVATDPGESVEWVNMCWRKVWRVYQRGLERWIIDLLQPVFDQLVKDGAVPRWLCRLRVVELTLDHEAPYFSNMRRRNSRKDSDLNGVVDLRYTGGARMLLLLELGEGRWRFKVPVLVSDLDLECQMWLKLRLAPMCPWIGTISLAFVGPPNVKVQLSPYNRVRLMRVPVVQNYLRKLLTVELPALMVLPQRLEVNIPPSVTTIAEAAVGRDTIMRAVASAVLQADAVEAALLAALPLGPQTPAGGVTLPEAFKGELSVTLREARNLPVWGFPGQSNPYCRLVLGEQAVQSRREGDTSHPGRHRAPVWNQEFQFLVEDPEKQVLEMLVKDSHLTGRTEVGRASIRLTDLLAAQCSAEGGKVSMWVPLQPPASYGITGGEAVPTGEVLVDLSYKPFDDEEQDSGCREAENYSKQAAAQSPITDIRSAAAASSRAAVAASAAVSAIAMTKAAAARAAARAARAAQEAAAAAAGAAKGAVDQGASMIGGAQAAAKAAAPPPPRAALPPAREQRQLPASTTAAKAVAPTASDAANAVTAASAPEPATGNGAPSNSAPVELSRVQNVKVIVSDDSTGSDGDGDDKGVGGDGGAAVRVQAQATALAAASGGGGEAMAVAVLSRSATAVLERPAPRLEQEAVVVGGDDERTATLGAGGGGFSGGAPLPLPPGGGQASWHQAARDGNGNGNGSGDGSHSALGHQAVASWRSDGNGAVGNQQAHVRTVQVRVTGVDVQPPQDATPPSESTLESVDVFDVTAELVSSTPPSPPPPAAAKETGQPTGHAGGVAAAGKPMLDALASWTASAQSLTASAVDKARESLGQKAHPHPPQPEKDKQAGSGGSNSDSSSGDGTGADWLKAIVALLPRYGGGPVAANPHHEDSTSGSDGGDKAAATAEGTAEAPSASASGDEGHPWWQFWSTKGGDGAAAEASTTAAEPPSAGADGGDKEQSRPWWQFWGDGGDKDKEQAKAKGKARRRRAKRAAADGAGTGADGDEDGGDVEEEEEGAKPVEAIYIPPDLPLEEIAAEVARLKEDSWRERSDHVSSLWMKAVERNDRKWLMLAAFLLSVAVGLLTVVAWRLEHLEAMQAAAPQIAVMTMHAALQALVQHSGGGGGDGGGLL